MPQGPTIQQKDELASGRRATRLYLRQNILDKYGRTTGRVVLDLDSAQRIAEQELNKNVGQVRRLKGGVRP